MSGILVTGASGTIGRELMAALKSRGISATAMSSRAGAGSSGTPAVQGDFLRPETLEQAFRGFDTIFLLLPLTPELPAMGRNAIAAAKAAGVKHVVRLSGGGADADSPIAIARVHGEIDRELRNSGLAWTLLKPVSFMQNFLSYHLEQILGGAYYAPHGKGATALIDVADIAESAAAVLANPAQHAGKSYNLTGGEAMDDAAHMALISAATGRQISYVDIPEDAARGAMSGLGYPPIMVDWLMSLNAAIKAGYSGTVSHDVELLTGRPPRRFADFVRANAQAWKPS